MKLLILIFSNILFLSHSYASSLCSDFFGKSKPKEISQLTKAELQEQRKKVDQFFQIIPSGRDTDTIPIYEDFVFELYRDGGTLDKLGIPRNPQIVEFMKGQDLNAVAKAGTGGYPISHYLDGAEVIEAYKDMRSLIYEVVYPGPKEQHAFYRDDNPVQQQLSILLHVIGHNFFANRSFFKGYRVDLGPKVSVELDQLMNRLYETEDKDEVMRWYLFLQSLMPYQDFYTGNYEYVHEFYPKNPKDRFPNFSARRQAGENLNVRHPVRPTENVLQAVVANIPANAEPWKREVAEKMAKLVSFQTALVRTQVMNEGWATFMQELLIKHMPKFNSLNYWLESVKLMNADKDVQLSDPYWLGVNGWRNLYDKFKLKSENQNLTPVELDKKFIAYADGLITTLDDFEFLKIALDDTWIFNHDLAIVRRATNNDDLSGLPQPPPSQEPLAPWIIQSRNADEVINHIIRTKVYSKFRFRPRLKLVDLNRQGSGEAEFMMNDPIGDRVPLKEDTIAPFLYVVSQVLEKPVSLEATFMGTREKPEEEKSDDWSWKFGGWTFQSSSNSAQGTPAVVAAPMLRNNHNSFGFFHGDFPRLEEYFYRGRIVVSPNGEVRAYKVKDGEIRLHGEEDIPFSKINGEDIDTNLKELHLQYLERYLADTYLENDEAYNQIIESNPRLRNISQSMVDHVVDSVSLNTLVDHVPSAAKAVMELKAMLDRRTQKALERAMTQGGGLINAGGRLYLKALPDTPTLSFDYQTLEKLFEEEQDQDIGDDDWFRRGPAQKTNLTLTSRGSFFKSVETFNNKDIDPNDKNDASVHPIGGDVGSPVWGPGKPQGGNGGGSGKKPGQPGDQPGGGPQPGEKPNDPSWVEIPMDMYAKYLGERINLPNLRPKKGPTKNQATRLGRKQTQRDGIMVTDDTFENALAKGIAAEILDGRDPTENLDATLESGFMFMEPERDIVVKKSKPKPKPDINAVITFVIDSSGSTAQYFEDYKRFVFDLKALIQHNYKRVQFRFVVFDSAAHEASERDFFRLRLGGGTNYAAANEKVKEIFEQNHPRSSWDRFVFVFGDLEDNVSPAAETFQELAEETEYVGVVRGSSWDMMDDLTRAIRAMSEESPYVGFIDLKGEKSIPIEMIRKLLKNDP